MATALRLIINTYFSDWLEGSKISLSYQAHLMIILVSELIIVLIGSLLSVAKQKYEYEKKYQESQRQFLQSELNYLRAQISPHFLLNSLNNIYCFAVASSPQTPAAVLKLSEMLKYFLYESSAAKIAVSREMEIIQSYIGLFILKFEVAPDISLTFSIKDEHKQIEPLLLMGLVENAFKHSGIGIQPNAYIHITAEEKGNQFIFTTTNSVLQVNETVGARGGIGLQNIARRVKLNYPGNHEMNVSEWDHSFSVQLVIPFI
jgi:LytS/YehU family sensor histidine kinase